MRENDRKPKFKTSAEVLQSLLSGRNEKSLGGKKQDSGIDHMADQFSRWKLWMNWSEVVGPTTAQCCEPVSFHQGVLTLWVKNSTWLTQISFMSETIKNTINQKYASSMVKEIRVTMDRKNVPQSNNQDFKNNLQKFIKK